MGVFTNLATTSQSITASKPRVGLDRASGEFLLAKAAALDPTIRTAFAAADEVQKIVEQTDAGVGDTYTLTISIRRIATGTFTTAGIAYDANAATIETAIDVAATAAGVTNWTNGDITVAEENTAGLDDGYITLTFDGASVTEQPCALTVVTPTGFTLVNTITRETDGGPDREAMQACYDLGIIEGTVPSTGAAPADWTKPAALVKRPRYCLIRDLVRQVAYEEGTDDAANAIIALYSLQPE